MAGIKDILKIYRGENLIDKYKNIIDHKIHKYNYPSVKKIGRFATDKLEHAQEYARGFPNVIKSAELPTKTVEIGKKLFDRSHFKQFEPHRSRLIMPKKVKDQLKIDILETFLSNAKALTPLAMKGLNVLASLPVATLTMVVQSTPTNADEVNMQLEDFAKLNEGSVNVDKALPVEVGDM